MQRTVAIVALALLSLAVSYAIVLVSPDTTPVDPASAVTTAE